MDSLATATVVLPDPTGERYGGIPTYPWGQAPRDLATRRQLAAKDLRKNRQDPVAQMIRPRRPRRGQPRPPLVAYLYAIDKAAPRRPFTPAKQAAVHTAARARRVCTGPCQRRDLPYIPRQAGERPGWCWDCIDGTPVTPAACPAGAQPVDGVRPSDLPARRTAPGAAAGGEPNTGTTDRGKGPRR